MKIIFIIQDVKTKEYYYMGDGIEGFSSVIASSHAFYSEQAAEEFILCESEWRNLFERRRIEIKKYYSSL